MSYFGINGSNKTPRTVNASQAREEDSHRRRVAGLERDYNENTSAISFRQKRLRESLLAYTQRLQALTRNRFSDVKNAASVKESELIVRASRIRKQSQLPSENGPRRIMSLNELLNRPDNNTVTPKDYHQTNDSTSEKIVLPIIDKVKGTSPRSVSLANASDLSEVCINTSSKPAKRRNASNLNGNPAVKLPGNVKTDLRSVSLPPIEHVPPRHNSHVQQQPTSPKDIYIILSNNKTQSRMRTGKELSQSSNSRAENKSRKRRKGGNSLLYKRMKLPSGNLDSIPEIDDDKSFSSAGTNQTRKRLAASRGSPNKSSVYYNTSFLPNLVSYVTDDLADVVRGQRKREWKIHDDQENLSPPKRPNSGRTSGEESLDGERRLRIFAREEDYLSSAQENKSNCRRKKRHRRLIFLRDSQEKK